LGATVAVEAKWSGASSQRLLRDVGQEVARHLDGQLQLRAAVLVLLLGGSMHVLQAALQHVHRVHHPDPAGPVSTSTARDSMALLVMSPRCSTSMWCSRRARRLDRQWRARHARVRR